MSKRILGRSKGMKKSQEVFTPESAQAALEKSNFDNRQLIHSKVVEYAGKMLRGEWTAGADDLCFGTDGRLLNGQHRLHAVILSGCHVEFSVKRDLDPSIQDNIDTGAKRTVQQSLRRAGVENSTNIVSWARTGRILLTGDNQSLSPQEVRAYMQYYFPSVEFGRRMITKRGLHSRSAVNGALVFAHHSAPKQVEDFFSLMLEGDELKKNSPVLTLRNYLGRLNVSSREDPLVISAKTLRAVYGHIRGEVILNDRLYAASDSVMEFFTSTHGQDSPLRITTQS